ncbi:MAG: ABC transporter ATP-binding protein [Verrucomicrobia bacterium]|nr:ABC transporter ATP-binding protein [Verrucomicrobiota bacterium]MCH8527248.1 ABC transporter ATP-binding protein [Kiritimatiellia bacterium]
MSNELLKVEDLRIGFQSGGARTEAVRGVSFSLRPGERLGLVGESGSGKTLSAKAVMGLIGGRPGERVSGSVRWDGEEWCGKPETAWRKLRGKEMAMVFQDPMTSLNPLMRVGDQIAEVPRLHEGMGKKAARRRAVEALAATGIEPAAERAREYPHQFSGGMRQRAVLAMAMICRPRLLIADEPTTALDVTIQAKLLALMRDLCIREQTALLFISHDLHVVRDVCERVAVMRHGEIVETGATADIFDHPQHPYTRALLAATPRIELEKNG